MKHSSRADWYDVSSPLVGTSFLIAALLLIYVPDLGRGFIKDDFVWIADSRLHSIRDVWALFLTQNGFYRPLVALSFGVSELAFGPNPFVYGLINLILVLSIVIVLVRLSTVMGMSAGAGVLMAGLWSLNFHGINMAVLWISGRTALFLTLFAALAARSTILGRRAAAAAWTLAALLSKEEAVALPLILFLWSGILTSDPGADLRVRFAAAARRTWPLFVVLSVYLVLRLKAGAVTPWTAPPYYRFTFDPADVIRNAAEYLDRSSTFAAAAVLIMAVSARGVGRLNDAEKRWAVSGCIWLIGGYTLTVFLPVRSSLYACWPSVGTCMVAGAFASATWRRFSPRGRTRVIAAALVLPVLLLPVYWSRNLRLKREAELSTTVLAQIRSVAAQLADGDSILVYDRRDQRPSLYSAFGALLPEAVLVATGRRLDVWLEPPASEAPNLHPPPDKQTRAVFALDDAGFHRVR